MGKGDGAVEQISHWEGKRERSERQEPGEISGGATGQVLSFTRQDMNKGTNPEESENQRSRKNDQKEE